MTANAPALVPSATERRVLEVIRSLLSELGSHRALETLSTKASLERELGLGSLERVELLDRLEKEFALSLPDQLLADAETPADLVGSLLRIQSSQEESQERGFSVSSLPGLSKTGPLQDQAEAGSATDTHHATPIQVCAIQTLNQALQEHARLDPAKPHIYLYEEEQAPRTICYGELLSGASAVSLGLRARGLQSRQTVAIMLPTGQDFFVAFFGILLAGGIPVPIYPPFRANRLEEYAQRQSRILKNAEIRFLITFRQAEKLAKLLKAGIPSLSAVLSVADLSQAPASGVCLQPEPIATDASVALIQYTSGSTGDPKGVVLTQANVIANIRAIGAGLNLQSTDVGVSWLPLYHDMGLIGSWLCALYFGVPIAILSPLAFLSRPERWLWAIHQHRATVSAAPNFAYELCARKIDDRSIEGLDLSSWRVALNGAEPISPETLERFTRRFERYGFRPETLLPVYGLAESSVALTFPPLGRKPRVDRIERSVFESTGEARVSEATDSLPLRFVCEGKALPNHEIRIVDDPGRTVAERKQGHIQFRGPSTMQGYFRNPEATRAIQQGGWVGTGDLGYLADGELFVTGRLKDVIIKGGRNLYPQEVEEVTSEIKGVRRGCIAAFGVPDAAMGTEKLVVVAETRETNREVQNQIISEIIARVDAYLGLPPDLVHLVPSQTVPKTSSGKIRRDACKQMYLTGELHLKPLPASLQVSRLVVASAFNQVRQTLVRVKEVFYGVYVWLVVALMLVPGWFFVWLLPSGDGNAKAFRILRTMCRMGLRLAGLEPKLEGQEHLEEVTRRFRDEGRSILLVSNHASYVDPVVVLAICPFNVCLVSKSDAASWPLIGALIRKCGFLTVDRDDLTQAAGVSESIARQLKQGSPVHVFPEATFTPAAGLRPFQMGAFKAVVEAGCPILPVTLAGTRNVLRDGTWLPRHKAIKVVVSSPLLPEENSWREMVRLRDAVREEFVKHCGEAPLDLVLAGPGK